MFSINGKYCETRVLAYQRITRLLRNGNNPITLEFRMRTSVRTGNVFQLKGGIQFMQQLVDRVLANALAKSANIKPEIAYCSICPGEIVVLTPFGYLAHLIVLADLKIKCHFTTRDKSRVIANEVMVRAAVAAEYTRLKEYAATRRS